MSEVFITEANSPEHWAAAEELILEYMIATEIEKGRYGQVDNGRPHCELFQRAFEVISRPD
jgi:hypothetical protein